MLLVELAPFSAVALFLTLLYAVTVSSPPFEKEFLGGLALVFASCGWIFYGGAIVRPINSPRVIRGLLAATSLPTAQRSYLEELARYKEAFGVHGQIPGDVRWSYIYSVIYYGACVASVVVSLGFYGALGPVAPGAFLLADAWVSILSFTLWLRRRRIELDRAEQRGFRLRELNPIFAGRKH